jgi:hypothetical protein
LNLGQRVSFQARQEGENAFGTDTRNKSQPIDIIQYMIMSVSGTSFEKDDRVQGYSMEKERGS